jgi:MFS family permease
LRGRVKGWETGASESTTILNENPPSAHAARLSVSAYFALFGLIFGTWVTHIPMAKTRLGADASDFGLALLCMALGAVVAMPAMGWFINRQGSARVCLVTGMLSLIFLLLPFMAPNLLLFSIGLLLLGAALGSLDVGMNAHGLLVEKQLARPVMSAFHGMYGVAALASAGLAAILITRIDEAYRAVLTMMVGFGIIFVFHRIMLPAHADRGHSEASFALPTRRTVWLGLLCLLAMMIESSTVDWAGIFLRDEANASPQLTPLAFAAFAGCLAVSRLLADGFREKWGSVPLVFCCAIFTSLSLFAAVTVPGPVLALVFFGLTGFFVGPIAPLFFAGGGRAEPRNPGGGISAVTTFGYLGSVCGPAIVGFIADASSLAWSLTVMAATALIIAAFARLAAIADG